MIRGNMRESIHCVCVCVCVCVREGALCVQMSVDWNRESKEDCGMKNNLDIKVKHRQLCHAEKFFYFL